MKTKAETKQVQEYPQEIIDCIDEQFPKGNKNRGKALVLQAVAYTFGRQNLKKEFLELIKSIDYDKNNIAIIEFKDLLTKIVKGRK